MEEAEAEGYGKGGVQGEGGFEAETGIEAETGLEADEAEGIVGDSKADSEADSFSVS